MKNIYSLFLALRPKSWIKNSIIFLPLFFSWKILNIHDTLSVFWIFILFSFFVGATYIINDYKDIENDKRHPKKKNRPLASWKINPNFALIFAILCILFCLFFSWFFFWYYSLLLFIIYWVNTSIYTLFLKKIEIIDIFSIAVGFVIRWLLWIAIISVEISPWFLIILFFWALWLWFFKRYQEVQVWGNIRDTIKKYNSHFLEQIISIMTTTLLVSYALYTFNSTQSQRFLLTLPLVAFLIIRMYYNIFFLKKFEHSFESIILEDKQIIIASIVFLLLSISIILLS